MGKGRLGTASFPASRARTCFSLWHQCPDEGEAQDLFLPGGRTSYRFLLAPDILSQPEAELVIQARLVILDRDAAPDLAELLREIFAKFLIADGADLLQRLHYVRHRVEPALGELSFFVGMLEVLDLPLLRLDLLLDLSEFAAGKLDFQPHVRDIVIDLAAAAFELLRLLPVLPVTDLEGKLAVGFPCSLELCREFISNPLQFLDPGDAIFAALVEGFDPCFRDCDRRFQGVGKGLLTPLIYRETRPCRLAGSARRCIRERPVNLRRTDA